MLASSVRASGSRAPARRDRPANPPLGTTSPPSITTHVWRYDARPRSGHAEPPHARRWRRDGDDIEIVSSTFPDGGAMTRPPRTLSRGRRWLRRAAFALGAAILLVAGAAGIAARMFAAPPYRGPTSAHFDGERFHNQVAGSHAGLGP